MDDGVEDFFTAGLVPDLMVILCEDRGELDGVVFLASGVVVLTPALNEDRGEERGDLLAVVVLVLREERGELEGVIFLTNPVVAVPVRCEDRGEI